MNRPVATIFWKVSVQEIVLKMDAKHQVGELGGGDGAGGGGNTSTKLLESSSRFVNRVSCYMELPVKQKASMIHCHRHPNNRTAHFSYMNRPPHDL